jgi:hypothetical protein
MEGWGCSRFRLLKDIVALWGKLERLNCGGAGFYQSCTARKISRKGAKSQRSKIERLGGFA